MIADHSGSESNAHRQARYQKMTDDTPCEFRTSKKPLMPVFVHSEFRV